MGRDNGGWGRTPAEYAADELLDIPAILARAREAFDARDRDGFEAALCRIDETVGPLEGMLYEFGREMRKARRILVRAWCSPEYTPPAVYRGQDRRMSEIAYIGPDRRRKAA